MIKNITTNPLLLLALSICAPFSTSAQDANEEKTVCEFVSEAAKATNTDLIFENMEKHKSSPFVRNYLVQIVHWESPNSSPSLASIKTSLSEMQANDFYEKHIRWGHNVGYLPYKGEWYKVHARTDSGAIRSAKSTGAFITAVTGEKLACAFKPKSIEIAVAEMTNWRRETKSKGSGLDCKKAIEPSNAKRANSPISKDVESDLIEKMGKDYYEGWFKKNAYFAPPYADGLTLPFSDGPILNIDVNNDGIEEVLVRVNYSESGNSPCGTFYYDLLSEDMKDLGEPKLREALLEAQGMTVRENGIRNLSCGRSHTILSVDGENYISSKRSLSRHISAIENNKAVKLCTSKFTIEPVIVFDAMTKDTQ